LKDDDLIAGTHGRGFLILDNITPLRQISKEIASADAHLYRPQTALRIRGDMNPPTPWVPEMPTGENPPDGAMIDYYLGPNATGPVTIEIYDSSNKLIDRFASTDPVPQLEEHYPVPLYWPRPPRVVSDRPGHHRFLWDMHYKAVLGVNAGPDAEQAVPHDTPSVPTSPWVMPGNYTVKLTAGGRTYSEPLVVHMDPRVKTSTADLQAQFNASKQLYDDAVQATEALHEISSLREQLHQRASNDATASFDKKLETLAGKAGFRRGPAGPPSLNGARGTAIRLQREMQGSDVAPTAQMIAAAATNRKAMADLLAQWQTLKGQDLTKVNAQLRQSHQNVLNPHLKTRSGEQDEIEGGNKDADEQ
jgi:hypothetical protein